MGGIREPEEYYNTPMIDTHPIKKCQFCIGDRKWEYACAILPKNRRSYFMLPCDYLQEIVCPRALKEKTEAP